MNRIEFKKLSILICSLFVLAACEKDSDDNNNDTSNVAALEITENVESNTTWENRIENPEAADYIITNSIEINADLIIEPGVKIEFVESSQIDVNGQGSLNATGTSAEPIVFTGEVETEGYWRGIRFNSPSSKNKLIYTELKYGGEDYYKWDGESIVWLDSDNNSSVIIQNTIFEGSYKYGLFADAGTELVDFENNTFTENNDAGLVIYASSLNQLDLQTDYNQNNGEAPVVVFGNEINNDQTWKAINTPYLLSNDHMEINADVTVEPGVDFKVGKELEINVNPSGSLNATGNANQMIRFTGNLETHGHWRGIRFNSPSSNNQLEYVEVAHAANHYYKWYGESAIWVDDEDNGKLSISNCEIHTNNDWGLTIDAGATIVPATISAILNGNDFHDNGLASSPNCTGDCNVNID